VKTGMDFDPVESFRHAFSKAISAEVDRSGFGIGDWFPSGRQSPLNAADWWWDNGPDLVRKYIDWYEASDDISVWTAPDGRPAVELDLTVRFGEVDVQMVIDQVLQVGSALVVTDLKTGAKAPESSLQLGIYACGIERAYGIRPKYGAYWMHRSDNPFKPVPLDGYEHSIRYLTGEFARFSRARTAGAYVANPGKQCDRCPVAHACIAAGGKDARKYDPSHPAYKRERH
jgi:hypothetical protein